MQMQFKAGTGTVGSTHHGVFVAAGAQRIFVQLARGRLRRLGGLSYVTRERWRAEVDDGPLRI